ncbi:threonine/serine exporter family protein [Sedimentibacter sp. zth1]|uniref:threonine/serine exporter family protein n=1 Tax=Sedimentibacter sp. zth1 TaxID=2816908 RepID=UPI001A910A3C|nr:threonine/serine exporter family protein [Sedimentibacter sp. zth1]QSX05131.1 threonine/serine exporter family protein [Sedimentibacter sp. zth1]
MLDLFLDLIYCFIATWFFALVMQAPRKSLVFSALIADIGYLIYIICVNNNYELFGFFLGTLVISLLGEICARKIKMPATIFIFPAVVPIVPGIGLYETMLKFVQNDIDQAIYLGIRTIFNIGAMAIAIALVSLLLTKLHKKVEKK